MSEIFKTYNDHTTEHNVNNNIICFLISVSTPVSTAPRRERIQHAVWHARRRLLGASAAVLQWRHFRSILNTILTPRRPVQQPRISRTLLDWKYTRFRHVLKQPSQNGLSYTDRKKANGKLTFSKYFILVWSGCSEIIVS